MSGEDSLNPAQVLEINDSIVAIKEDLEYTNISNTDHIILHKARPIDSRRPSAKSESELLVEILEKKEKSISRIRTEFKKLEEKFSPVIIQELKDALDNVTENHSDKTSVRCAYHLDEDRWEALEEFKEEAFKREKLLITGSEKTKLGKDYDKVTVLTSALLASSNPKFLRDFRDEITPTKAQDVIEHLIVEKSVRNPLENLVVEKSIENQPLFSEEVNKAIKKVYYSTDKTTRDLSDQYLIHTSPLPIIKFSDYDEKQLSDIADIAYRRGGFTLETEEHGAIKHENHDGLRYLLTAYYALPPDVSATGRHKEAFFRENFDKHHDKPLALEDLKIIKKHLESRDASKKEISDYLITLIDENIKIASEQRITLASKEHTPRALSVIEKLASEGRTAKFEKNKWDALRYLLVANEVVPKTEWISRDGSCSLSKDNFYNYRDKPLSLKNLEIIKEHLPSVGILDEHSREYFRKLIDKNIASRRSLEYWDAQDVHKATKDFDKESLSSDIRTLSETITIPKDGNALTSDSRIGNSKSRKLKSILKQNPEAASIFHDSAFLHEEKDSPPIAASSRERKAVHFR